MTRRISILLAASLLTLGLPAFAADGMEDELHAVMGEWARIMYDLPEDQQEGGFMSLAERSEALGHRFPDRAEPKIWEAIVRASHAGSMSGFSSLFNALPEVTRARELLLAAEKIDARALNGSVYSSLGSLYYQVPGSPIGFGDTDKALQYLERAIEVSPDGIDSNYFMGDYWLQQGEMASAKRYLERALRAPARPERVLADRGRRQEIRAALRDVRERAG